MVALVSLLVSACQNGGGTGGGSSSTSSSSSTKKNISTSGTTTTTAASETQCTIFQTNAKDYSTCLGCKTSMCPCTRFIGSTCVETNLTACTVDLNTLVQCVHDNLTSAGGPCVGLRCGEGQIADFASCSCKDANPPSSIGSPPGQDDTLSPYMEPGFVVSNRICPPGDIASGIPSSLGDCFKNGIGATGTYIGTAPIHQPTAPANVLTDVGYVRWDLALDASQFSVAKPLYYRQPSAYTWATFPISLNMFYQLKSNTVLSTNSVSWNDCVEPFSGFTSDATTTSTTTMSSGVPCNLSTDTTRYFNDTTDNRSFAAPQAADVLLEATSTMAGTAIMKYISANGKGANKNITDYQANGNPQIKTYVAQAGTPVTPIGVAKAYKSGSTAAVTETELATGQGIGLFSNIGYYKYSWGPLRVRRPTTPVGGADVASTTVTGRVALNVNLGYSPASTVESSAMSPDALTNTMTSYDCSTTNTAIPNPCVVTSVYRSSGGGVLAQSFGPQFSTNNQSSSISALPSGIVAASTPKVIEDRSQLVDSSSLDIKKPSRLRVFTRAVDGNVYMSKFEQGKWFPWMNLGRPWLCNMDATSTFNQCPGLIASGPAALSPYDHLQGGKPAGTIYTSKQNDGIAIAGEPTVASYMDGTGLGIIAIFARVTHIKSSTGLPGPFHNTVWYTFAVASGQLVTGQQPDFDNIRTWTNWMPIKDGTLGGAGTYMSIMGNPVAMVRRTDSSGKNSATSATALETLYVWGTDSRDTAGATKLLHPPISYDPAAGAYSGALNNVTFAVGTHDNWYNYSNRIVRSSLDISGFKTGTANWVYQTPALPWRTITSERSNRPLISEWSIAPVDPDTSSGTGTGDISTNYNRVWLYNNSLVSHSCDTIDANSSASNITASDSPCKYAHELMNVDFGFDNTAPSGTTFNCTQRYQGIDFVGGVAPINLADVLPGNGGALSGTTDPIGSPTAGRMVVFGRAICPDPARCDPANPTLAYAVSNAFAGAGGSCTPGLGALDVDRDSVMYYAGMHRSSSGGFLTPGTRVLIQNARSTSDPVVAFSHALWRTKKADAPAYVLFRDATGSISHGFFDGFQALATGNRFWNLFTSGSFTN